VLVVDASGNGRVLLGSGGAPLGSSPGGRVRRAEQAEGDVVVLPSDGPAERRDRPWTAGPDEPIGPAGAVTVGRLWPAGISSSAVSVLTASRQAFALDLVGLTRRPALPRGDRHAPGGRR
jgi:hypothetical protein